MTARLAISVRRHEGASVIVLLGELDRLSAPSLDDVLAAQLDAGVRWLLLDVVDLRFCDSTGLWTMLGFLRRALRAGGGLRLAGVHGVLGRILQITGLTVTFPLDPDVATSLRVVASPAREARDRRGGDAEAADHAGPADDFGVGAAEGGGDRAGGQRGLRLP